MVERWFRAYEDEARDYRNPDGSWKILPYSKELMLLTVLGLVATLAAAVVLCG